MAVFKIDSDSMRFKVLPLGLLLLSIGAKIYENETAMRLGQAREN
jgi:hypothetical protein